ncbi:intraflagellar transport protein 57 homolog [Aethina tumida]|uniref:intraflagellar transport protein 57 homolog n=1 Tax=Aethina tumida TaxID=116153 RepID=UPI00214767F1|nr:intraflagellar transport protein 57 homolog [Aethina tumida]
MQKEKKIVSDTEQEYPFISFVDCEDLSNKLKLLNYEDEFLKDLKIKPIHKFYFVVAKNPGEQFYLFSLLAAWLVRKVGKEFVQPQEYDDPNETINKILEAVKENGLNVDFSASKLKQGFGEQVVNILDNLATAALKHKNFKWDSPKAPEETEEEVDVMEDESEINLDRVEEEMIAAYSDDSDEENIFRLDDLKPRKREITASELKSNIDEESWRIEVERVLPQLKVTIKNDSRDWRAHFEQMKNHKNNIELTLNPTKTHLEKLHKDISSTLDKVGSREKYLNRELEDTLQQYRLLQDQLSQVRDKYKSVSSGVADRNRELSKLTDRLETVKQQMEERGSSMTDGTPLVNIKKSVAKIRQEIIDIDVRIGVLECILLQTKIRDEKQLENEFGQSISIF